MKWLNKLGIDIKKTGILAGILMVLLLALTLYEKITDGFSAGIVVICTILSLISAIVAALYVGLTKAYFKKYFPKSKLTVFNAFRSCVFVLIIIIVVKNITEIYNSIDSYIYIGYGLFEILVRGLLLIAFKYAGSFLLYVLVGFIYTKAILLEKLNKNAVNEIEEEDKTTNILDNENKE